MRMVFCIQYVKILIVQTLTYFIVTRLEFGAERS